MNMTASEQTGSDFEPSRPESLTSDVRESADGLAVTVRQTNGSGGFLLLWEIGWTVACIALAVQVISNPEIGTFLFALPFWAAWLAVGSLLIWFFFGTETILIQADRVLFLRKALITLKVREVPISEVKRFRSSRSKHLEDNEYLYGIEAETIGKPIRFGFRLPARERQWLIWKLNQFAEFISEGSEPQEPIEAELPGPPASDAPGRLTAADVLDEPPTDCRWQLHERADGVEFVQRGQFQPGAFFGLLFINAFWNGIVGVFVALLLGLMPVENGPPQGFEWWGMFVFLLPFEVVGLGMLAALVMVLAEPFRVTSWRLVHDTMTRQSRWPVVRITRRWSMEEIHHLELRLDDEESSGRLKEKLSSGISDDANYQLTFVSRDNIDQCSIASLTSGEARWMAGELFGFHPQWSHVLR